MSSATRVAGSLAIGRKPAPLTTDLDLCQILRSTPTPTAAIHPAVSTKILKNDDFYPVPTTTPTQPPPPTPPSQLKS